MKDIYDVLERLVICEPGTLETGCWEWPGGLFDSGYGQAKLAGRPRRVHRLVYEHFRGPVPEELELDHLCRNRKCANFEHLDPGPHRVNVLRGEGLAAKNARKTHCIKGHPLEGGNLTVTRDGKKRSCLECRRQAMREYRQRRKLEGSKGGDPIAKSFP